jgi:hypothetical protein
MALTRVADWSLRTKVGALLVTASVLPLMVVAVSDVRDAISLCELPQTSARPAAEDRP